MGQLRNFFRVNQKTFYSVIWLSIDTCTDIYLIIIRTFFICQPIDLFATTALVTRETSAFFVLSVV